MEHGRTSRFLMANLGSEVMRAFSYYNKGDDEEVRSSVTRARGILEDIRKKPDMESRDKELLILEAVLTDLLAEERAYSVTREQMATLFNPLALALTGGT